MSKLKLDHQIPNGTITIDLNKTILIALLIVNYIIYFIINLTPYAEYYQLCIHEQLRSVYD